MYIYIYIVYIVYTYICINVSNFNKDLALQILHIRIFAQIRCPRAASVVMAKKDTEVPDAEVEKNEEEDPHNDEKDDEPGQKEDDEPGQKEEASEEGDGDQSTISLKKPASKLAKQKAKKKAKAKLSPKLMKSPKSLANSLTFLPCSLLLGANSKIS